MWTLYTHPIACSIKNFQQSIIFISTKVNHFAIALPAPVENLNFPPTNVSPDKMTSSKKNLFFDLLYRYRNQYTNCDSRKCILGKTVRPSFLFSVLWPEKNLYADADAGPADAGHQIAK